MDTLLQDVRYAARTLLRTPGFTLIALTTLALAIGATTAVFSIVDGVLLRPLPYPEPQQLVRVGSANPRGEAPGGAPRVGAMSAPDYLDYRARSRSFAALAPINGGSRNLTGGGAQPERLETASVGARFFDVLGVRAQLGRTFAADEDSTGAPKVVVLSDALWRTRFAGDPRLVGQTIALDGDRYTVIGIAPPRFSYPSRVQAWLPLVFEPWMTDPHNRGAHWLRGIGRLHAGVTPAQASRELEGIGGQLAAQYPASNTNFTGAVQSLQESMVGSASTALWPMLGAVAFVLLIACANVANLLLVRAASRESEIAVRTALGAGRLRLVRQLVTESVLLSAVGAVLGAALAAWAVDAVVAFGPQLPRLDEVAIGGRVLGFTAAIAVATGILFGLVPALHAARPDISQMLRESVRGSSRGATQRTRNALVVTEMALAVVLLVGAGLLIRSFARLVHVDPGFRAEQVVTFDVSLPDPKYVLDRTKIALVDQVTERLRRVPGTQEVGATFGRPLQDFTARTGFEVAGWAPSTPDSRRLVELHPASASFFRALRIPVLRGRLWTPDEDRVGATQALVISQETARRYFPDGDAIGKRLTLGISHDTADTNSSVRAAGTIVGIVADVKQQGLASDIFPMVYLPFNTLPFSDVSFSVRSTADPALVASAVRTQVREVDPDLPVHGLMTMDQAVARSIAEPRFFMLLLSAFAGVALFLAALGIYGVISYAVSLRTRELGIRLALGATNDRVVRLVLGQGLWLTIGGIVAGLAAALWLARLLQALLFGVGTSDPSTFVAVALVLGAVAVLASWLPARRAARVDPVITMRAD